MIYKNILFLLLLLSLACPQIEAQESVLFTKSMLSIHNRNTGFQSMPSATFGSSMSDVLLTGQFNSSLDEHSEVRGITLFSGLGSNIVNSFKGDNLYLHLAGIASTAIIVTTNTDYYVHKYFNEYESYGSAARPVIRFGMYFPFAVGGYLYAFGKLNRDDEALAASFAVLQSSLIAFTYNSLLKALTGRPNPRWREDEDMKDLSKVFRFGFGRGGIFWGWPSGHTSSTVAVVSALTNFYPDKTWLKIAGYTYVAYMIFAVSSLNRGGMHWFSDAVAAAFISYAIGSTVGKHFRSKFKKNTSGEANYEFQYFPAFSYKYYF